MRRYAEYKEDEITLRVQVVEILSVFFDLMYQPRKLVEARMSVVHAMCQAYWKLLQNGRPENQPNVTSRYTQLIIRVARSSYLGSVVFLTKRSAIMVAYPKNSLSAVSSELYQQSLIVVRHIIRWESSFPVMGGRLAGSRRR